MLIARIFKHSPWSDFNKDFNIFNKHNVNHYPNFKFIFQIKWIIYFLITIILLWLLSGIYEIKEGEEAVIIRFGKFVKKSYPGLNYHLPYPIESVIIEKVNKSRRIEIGYRSSTNIGNRKYSTSNYSNKSISAESTMLTGDENIIELNCDVMWHINDLKKFTFNILKPEETVKNAAESAIREIIGKTPILSVLSNQKQEISVKLENLTQKILDQYESGVCIEKIQLLKAEPPTEVIDAYRDVQTSKADKEREINQAQAYNNDILPKARGDAAKILEKAKAYKQEVIAKAEGESNRFNSVYKQYSLNKAITRSRLYLEAVEKILQGTNKVIVSNNNILQHMNVKSNIPKKE